MKTNLDYQTKTQTVGQDWSIGAFEHFSNGAIDHWIFGALSIPFLANKADFWKFRAVLISHYCSTHLNSVSILSGLVAKQHL